MKLSKLANPWPCTAWAIMVVFLCSSMPLPGVGAQEGCENALSEAEKKFDTGLLYEVIELLTPCLKTLENEKQEEQLILVYELLALSYLATDQNAIARKQIRKILELNRDYLPTSPYSVQYKNMVEEVRKEMPKKIRLNQLLIFGGGGILAAAITFFAVRSNK